MKFDFLYHRRVHLNSTENGRQIFLFRVPVVYAEKLHFFQASQQSICHTAVYLHLGYRFLLGQTEISNKAVGRAMKEISVSLLTESAIHVLASHPGLCSDVLSQLAAKSCGCRGTGEKQVGMICTSMKPLPGKPGHDGLIGWAVSCH